MDLQRIERIAKPTKAEFHQNYFKPQNPVIIEGGIDHWPAFKKWNFDYIRSVAGDKRVPLYDDRPVDYKDGFNQPHAQMNMSDYIDLLEREPTKFRIFLWNLLKLYLKVT